MESVGIVPTPEAGEIVSVPPRVEWVDVLRRNLSAIARWEFTVAGQSVGEFRRAVRKDALSRAASFSERLGVAVMRPQGPDSPIVLTGHQPELYHPGIWVKDFLLDGIAREAGASAVDLVVDTDGFDSLEVGAPCRIPVVRRCTVVLAEGGADVCYACAPVPPEEVVDAFCRSTDAMLATLPVEGPRHNFERFSAHLRDAARRAENVAELVTFARRTFESTAGTHYLEVPVTSLAGSDGFRVFACALARDAERFVRTYNGELDRYRAATGTRSAAQPFPNLAVDGGRYELPFWLLGPGGRSTLWAEPSSDGTARLFSGDSEIAAVPCLSDGEPDPQLEGVQLAPKALTLTMFARLFVADLFIHGLGGARYDKVTDGVIRRYFGVEPPEFVVASATLVLPLGVPVVTDQDIAAASERINRFEHNPDALVGEAGFASDEEERRVTRLSEEKRTLIARLSDAGADRKALGLRIRELNASMREILAPLGVQLRAELDRLSAEREVAEVLTDRTYPFCYWDPVVVAARVR